LLSPSTIFYLGEEKGKGRDLEGERREGKKTLPYLPGLPYAAGEKKEEAEAFLE